MNAYMGISNYQLNHHFRPKKGWMNDPNGLVYFQGYYHIFFQYSPNYEWAKGPMVWGHARTKDFLIWEELPIALHADCAYDENGCWSGTAIVKDGVLYLFYASLIADNTQRISVAYSRDGIHFEKHADNPVIRECPIPHLIDFRDPAVVEKDGKYYLAVASGDRERQQAYLFYYESENLLDWSYCGILKSWHERVYCECPSMQMMGDALLLATSVVYKDGKTHEFFLATGRMENGEFIQELEGRPQLGPDCYAGQIFTDARGRNILLSWLPGWEYMGFAERSLGCLSLPMEITCQDGKLNVYPVEEVRHVLKDCDENVVVDENGFTIHRTEKPDVVFRGVIHDLKILRDNYIIEIFINHGEYVVAAVLC